MGRRIPLHAVDSPPESLLFVVLVAVGGIGAAVAMLEGMSPETHHTVEHLLDVVMVALVVGAVYYARTTAPRRDSTG